MQIVKKLYMTLMKIFGLKIVEINLNYVLIYNV